MNNCLLEDEGVRIVVGHFDSFPGRKLRDIIDESGMVFKPNPYDIPRDPYRVLEFSLRFILAMIDSNRMPANGIGPFITDEDRIQYRKKTMELLSGLSAFLITKKEMSIQYQPQSKISRREIKKYL